MRFLLLILIIIIVIFLLKKSKKKTSINQVQHSFEDPLETSFEYEEETNLEIQFPLFHFIEKDIGFHKLLNNEEIELSKLLLILKSEETRWALIKLIKEIKPRKKTGLPKFLQVLPINQLIKTKILIHPVEDDIKLILSTFKLDELKEICITLGVKPSKLKKDTILNLSQEDLSKITNLSNYFKINPIIISIYDKLGDFCNYYLREKISTLKEIEFIKINLEIDQTELKESVTVGNFTLRNYGYNSVIWFKDNNPYFKILGVRIDGYSNRILLLQNKLFCVFQQLSMGDWAVSRVSIIDHKPEVLVTFDINTPNYAELKELPTIQYLIIELLDNQLWGLNYSGLKEHYFKNPDNLDMYTLINNGQSK
jgi:hypothetical protein